MNDQRLDMKNLNLQKKISIVLLFPILLILISCLFSITSINTIKKNLKEKITSQEIYQEIESTIIQQKKIFLVMLFITFLLLLILNFVVVRSFQPIQLTSYKIFKIVDNITKHKVDDKKLKKDIDELDDLSLLLNEVVNGHEFNKADLENL